MSDANAQARAYRRQNEEHASKVAARRIAPWPRRDPVCLVVARLAAGTGLGAMVLWLLAALVSG